MAGFSAAAPPTDVPSHVNACTSSCPGAFPESWLDSSNMPSVGFVDCKNGAASTSQIPPTTSAYFARRRARRSGSAFAAIATASRISGTTALAFTDMPSPRQIAAARSRRAKTNDTAHATKNATSTSLWPPPTTWYTTIGFNPITATAKTARSGRTRLTSRYTTIIVPMLEIAATTWNPRITLCTLRRAPVVTIDTQVNSGP